MYARRSNPAIAKNGGRRATDGTKEAVEPRSAATKFRTSMAPMQAQGSPSFVAACLFFSWLFSFNI